MKVMVSKKTKSFVYDCWDNKKRKRNNEKPGVDKRTAKAKGA